MGGWLAYVQQNLGAAAAPAPPVALFAATRRRRAAALASGTSDFWVAFRAWFAADPALALAFPGGILHASAPGGRAYPFARHSQAEPMEPLSAEDWPMETVLSAYAQTRDSGPSGDDESRRLVRLIAARFDAASARSPVRFGAWRESGHRWDGRVDVSALGPGPGGGNVYRADLGLVVHVVSDTPQDSGPW